MMWTDKTSIQYEYPVTQKPIGLSGREVRVRDRESTLSITPKSQFHLTYPQILVGQIKSFWGKIIQLLMRGECNDTTQTTINQTSFYLCDPRSTIQKQLCPLLVCDRRGW